MRHTGLTHDFKSILVLLVSLQKDQEMLHNLFSLNFLSGPKSIQSPGHFLFRVFNYRHDVHSAGWRRYVKGIPSIFSYYQYL